MFKPKRPEVGTWKTNQPKVQGRVTKLEAHLWIVAEQVLKGRSKIGL